MSYVLGTIKYKRIPSMVDIYLSQGTNDDSFKIQNSQRKIIESS